MRGIAFGAVLALVALPGALAEVGPVNFETPVRQLTVEPQAFATSLATLSIVGSVRA